MTYSKIGNSRTLEESDSIVAYLKSYRPYGGGNHLLMWGDLEIDIE
jgi:hypothetical protein